MKPVLKTLVIAMWGAASLVAVQRAEAQVAVDVNITLGSVTILYYNSLIDVNVPDAQMAALFAGDLTACTTPGAGAATADCDIGSLFEDATFTAGVLDVPGTLGPNPSPALTLTGIQMNLQNVWAVRAIGGGPTTTVTVALGTTPTLGSAGSGNIVVSAPTIDDDGTGCDGAANTQFADPGLASAQVGSVCLRLNLTGATGSGPFDVGTSVYTLSVAST